MRQWKPICTLADIPRLGSRVVQGSRGGDIAVFRTADDRVFALHDRCAHKNGPLSQGIVHGDKVTCPLHGWNFNLQNGQAVAPDAGSCATFAVKEEAGQVYLEVD